VTPPPSARLRSTAAPLPKQERSVDTRRRLLDAAVDELLESGYARMTSTAAAHRAGVSRGAQQHHFPTKESLVIEAVRHIAARGNEQFEAGLRAARSARGRQRGELVIDVIYEAYSGRLFGEMMELSLAARNEPVLREAIDGTEREFSSRLEELGRSLFADDDAAGVALRWALVVAAIRGVATLTLLGHPPRAVALQWNALRPELSRILTDAPELT
jgi:AcrR family transcriptional regulator